MRMNTLKSKIVAGTAAVALVSGAGLVAANTDAGTALKEWYDGAFNGAASDFRSEVTAYGSSQFPGLVNEYNQLKSEAAGSINTKKNTETTSAESKIDAAKQSHIDNVNDKEAEISAAMEAQFNELFNKAQKELNSYGGKARYYATEDLTDFTEDNGSAALDEVREDLETAKEDAVTELETEIVNTKEALLSELGSEKDTTVAELNARIDAKIVELRGFVKKLIDELVIEQQVLIAAEAERLEGEAKQELDDALSLFNQ